MPTLDSIHKIATISIALCSLATTVYIFIITKFNTTKDKAKDRNFQSFKALILDHNLKALYVFFENTSSLLSGFQTEGLSDEEKQLINEKISDEFIVLRQKFIDVLMAVDKNLYKMVLGKIDGHQDYLTESIFDSGLNLSHKPKFNEIIISKQGVAKTDILTILFEYKG
jgi:hypothetical protein